MAELRALVSLGTDSLGRTVEPTARAVLREALNALEKTQRALVATEEHLARFHGCEHTP